ncbi:ABC transporter substrate-binding protein [Oscillochloris sp. ZM17-4]|uniref:ABC transporter substrate-binding protein n=1 Tax=Oscillochloris sp. ZM17-4 TaxID=2866714 RepID=UPI001C733110|nr:ABC transporter substrate-binding protein [Oscillochloris sp. ZM17-4]MBX0328297.1 ABC transporter substrate-binding protein [Oscillochloris sp. ZM17-4]
MRASFRHRSTIGDMLATGVLLAYLWLAWGAEAGGGAGPALDRVWAAAQARGSLRVAVDVGFRPFVEQRDGDLAGYDVDLARAVAGRLGLRAEFVPIGFDALYNALVSDQADMIASALPYAPEEGERARFSSFYFDAGQVLLVPEGSPVAGAADLAGRRVGVALGSDADALARRLALATPSIDLRSTYDEPGQAIADLRAGRLDAAICDNVSALAAAQSAPGLRIAAALSSQPYALAVPASAFQLQAEVNRALAELRAEGLFEELNRRWLR